jgi:methylphosphotriester-DNA--protein-cysteine methyltransferase
MRVKIFKPSPLLAPFVRTFTVIEAPMDATRVLIPELGAVLGFRYRGHSEQLETGTPVRLPDMVFTGIRETVRHMRTSAGGGIVIAALRETGFAELFTQSPHELAGTTIALEELVSRSETERIASAIRTATNDEARVSLVERFLLARRLHGRADTLVSAAVRAIHVTHGSTRIAALASQLDISQDRLEKRFRHRVGLSPKRLASIVRLRHAIGLHRPGLPLAQLSADAGYFDQSHFIRECKSILGQTPQRFFDTPEHC